MSYTDPYYEESDYVDEDPLAYLMMGGVYPSTNPQYSKDPLSGLKSQQSLLNTQQRLLGFSPIQEFGGPPVQPYTPLSDILLQELDPEDPVTGALLTDIQSGVGTLSLQRKLAAARAKNEDDPNQGLDENQYESLRDWLERFSMAKAKDQMELSNAEQMGTEGDPYGNVPLNPTPQEYLDTAEAGGAFDKFGGQEDTLTQYIRKISKQRLGRDVVPEGNVEAGTAQGFLRKGLDALPAEDDERMDKGIAGAAMHRIAREKNRRGEAWRAPAFNRANDRARFRLAQEAARQQGTRPSAAQDRARANIIAYRMAMGLSPT